ncbi:hypothetical protein GCM10027024_08350 [Microbacterium insulae]
MHPGTPDTEFSAGVSGQGDGDDWHPTSVGGAPDIGSGGPAFPGVYQTRTGILGLVDDCAVSLPE